MHKLIVSGAALVLGAQALLAAETLCYLDFDDNAKSVKAGNDLLPFVCDSALTACRTGDNAGYLHVPSGENVVETLPTSVQTANEELTVEFFIKGDPTTLGTWQWLFSTGWAWDSDYGILLDSDASKNIRLRIKTTDNKEYAVTTGCSLTNGKWRHVAVTVKPISDGTASHVECFVDYALVSSFDTSAPYRYSKGGSVVTINRYQNSSMGGCDVDEVRFTRGALMPDQFLRLSNPLPADGVLRVPFDDDPSSVTTADDLYKTLLKGSGSALTFTENLGYLKLLAGEDEKRYRFTYDQFLQKKDDLTVEFFIKGNENLPVWSLPVSFSDTSGGNQLFRIEATKDFNLRLTVLNSRYSTAPCLLTDGKWHHVAMRIHPTDTGCRIEPYFDYVAYDFMYGASKEFDSAFPFHWFSSSMLRLNCAKQGIDIDELRFTHGLLEPKEFVRLELAKPPVDGETLMYLPFEGDARTIAHADHQGQVTGAERYVDATRTRTAVKEKESRAVVREENLKYFEETGAECYVYNDYWALQNPNCDTCTIEFFIRGGANVKSWQSALCYGYWKGAGQYGFLIQVDDNKQMWFKPGVGSREVGFTVPVDLSKAKWHHVAVQVSPSQAEGCAGGSHFDIFVDYGETPVSSRDYAEAFNGLDRRMIFFNATGGAELAFDELRVTKGLLPVSKFLSFDRLGMILTVK